MRISPVHLTINKEDHKEIHQSLHSYLDELVADWIAHTGKLPSEHTILELMEWSHKQTLDPDN